MSNQRKRKPYKASKEVKRRARILQGQAPSAKRFEDRRKKPPKYKRAATLDSE